MISEHFSEFLSKKAAEMERKSQDKFTISFSELEALASPLPRSAFKHRAWWANNGSKAWLKAGFRTEAVDMQRQQVTFRRAHPSPTQPSTPNAAGQDFHEESSHFHFRVEPGQPDRPHPLVGVLRGKIRIAADLDVTAPADPDWGKVYDQ